MNSALNIALMKCFTEIPRDIIDLAFKNREPYERDYTLEEMVNQHVIQRRVRTMLNLFGGKLKDIYLTEKLLEKMHNELLDNVTITGPFSIYRIPPDEREGLDIIDVVGIKFAAQYHTGFQNAHFTGHSNSVTAVGRSVIDSHSGANMFLLPDAEALNGNLIRLSPSQHTSYQFVCTCRLAHDEAFTNLSNNMMDTFADYAVCCLKMYIYNTLVVAVDRAYVESGQEIGVVKTIIDTYSDAAEKAKEYEEQLQGACYQDPRMLKQFYEYML